MTPTEEQKALIYLESGNALVDAGPGSGKTTTLIEFILNRALTTPASAIAVLMFNSDIQVDFVARIKKRGVMDLPKIKTFHAFAMEMLRQSGHLNRIGFTLNMDSGSEQIQMARAALKVIADNTHSPRIASIIRESKTADTLLSFIGLVKAHMLPVEEVFKIAGIAPSYSFLIPAFYEFEKAREAEGVLFFDDWALEAVKLLKKDATVRQAYQNKFSLILVDEFQDINAAQYEMVKLLKGQYTDVVVVGDVDQSIYSWRGSNPGFMLTFHQDFSPCQRLTLSKTFRYGHKLSLMANHLISHNKQRFDSICTPAPSTPQTVVEVIGTIRPANETLTTILAHMEGGGNPADCAVLVRRWSQAMLFELSFLIRRIPYQMPAEFALPNSKEIKLLTVLLTFVSGLDSVLAPEERTNMIYEVLRFPHTYVPNTTLMNIARRLGTIAPDQWTSAIDAIQFANVAGKKTNWENVRERLSIVHQLCAMKNSHAVEVFCLYREESNMDDWLQNSSASASDYEEAVERLESLCLVLKSMKLSCTDALEYFRRLILLSEQTTKKKQGVTLTTMFRAKGCEYHTVLLPNWDADTLPMKKNNDAGMGTDEEEERRLAYVGMTRAIHKLKIFHTAAAEGEYQLAKASKFIREADYEHSLLVADAISGKGDMPDSRTPISQRYLEKVAR